MLDQRANLIRQESFAVLCRATEFNTLFLMSHKATLRADSSLIVRQRPQLEWRRRRSLAARRDLDRISSRDPAEAVAVYL